MSGELRRYPAYRDTGLPWLGEIPAHWEVRRNGRLFSVRRELADPELPLLEVSLRTGVRVRPLGEGARKQVMADRTKYQVARAGDIVYNTMRMWQGAVGVAPVDGLVSPAYVVVRPHADVEPRYYAYLFRTAAYLQQIEIESRGIVPDRNRLYWEAFKAMPSVHPPQNDQCAVANYLDAQTSLAHRFTRVKRQVLSLLAERSRAGIRQTISKGSQTEPEFAESGRWFGAVPANWRVAKLRHVVEATGGMTPPKSEPEFWAGAMPWVSPKDMKTARISDAQDHLSNAALSSTGIPVVPPGSILMVVRGMILARTIPFALTVAPVTINQDMKALTPRDGVNAEYLLLVLTAAERHLLTQVDESGHGTRKLPTAAWRDLLIPVPPIDEQLSIVAEVEERIAREGALAAQEERGIELVQSLTDRVVRDAVLGQFVVDGDAAKSSCNDAALFSTMARDDESLADGWPEEMEEVDAIEVVDAD